MRVLYLDHAADRISGAEFRLLDLARRLPAHGVTPVVACAPGSPLDARLATLGVERVPVVFPNLHANGTVGKLAGNGRDLARTVRALGRAIRRQRIDLVHVNTLWPRLPGLLAARWTRRPVVWHIRDFVIQPAWRRLYRLAGSLVDRVLTVSDACHTELPGHSRMSTLPNGLDLKRYRGDRAAGRELLGVGADDLAVGLCGELVPWKGHEILLEAGARLAAGGCRPILVIVGGSGPDSAARRAQLQATAGRLGIGREVRFPGFCQDMPGLLAGLDVVAVPSLRPDPLPGTVLEAMAMALPVVASRIGGIPEMVQDGATGHLINPGDAAGLAQAIQGLAGDPERRERMGRAGRLVVEERFSLDEAVSRLLSVYRALPRSGARR